MNERRPMVTDPDVIQAAIQKVLPEVVQWCRLGEDLSPESEIADDLRKVVDLSDDGYGLCRNLEKYHHWTCDSELVAILDNLCVSSARGSMEIEWVKAYRVYPGHLPGAKVEWRGHPAEILGSNSDGKYTVNVPALGHVKQGLGTHGEVVAWEIIDGKVNMLGLTITGPLLEATA